MPRTLLFESGCKWSWKRFFISLTVVFTALSAGLWWQSGRCPFTPEEVRFRILMIEYVHTKNQLDNFYMEASTTSVNQFNTNLRISHLCKSFEQFLVRYPDHDQAMNVYGTFLDEIGDGDKAVEWWERAIEFSRQNPQLLNNLANYYGHNGRAIDAIRLYEEALILDPDEPVYHFNLGNMYYLFRKETNEIHGWDLDKTFEKSLNHFKQARDLSPGNPSYAISYAETYYGVKFLSQKFDWNDAESAWLQCLHLNSRPDYKDSIRVHLVRINSYRASPCAPWSGMARLNPPAPARSPGRF
jgi:tetratricopeptide (TPR) repeat protein